MATATINKTEVLEVMECITCGVSFAIPRPMLVQHREHGGFHYCPNGHPQGWQKGRVQREQEDLKVQQDRLKQQLASEARRREILETELEYERRSAAAYKGQTTRLKKRIANGSCPVCHRNFSALHRHMQCKHPEYVAETERFTDAVRVQAHTREGEGK